ncbi:hypothetical protein CSOJ01_14893 [Colletotrichum sojae]|uniref:Uncharacterized protein n=1 Tax=Colletotrichum sojae TaxID=2175907 RepID=A0A8H6INU5_9PEZI|nr:hypothetical protein CSOJ01_14893 [Colletotrichum sojae]
MCGVRRSPRSQGGQCHSSVATHLEDVSCEKIRARSSPGLSNPARDPPGCAVSAASFWNRFMTRFIDPTELIEREKLRLFPAASQTLELELDTGTFETGIAAVAARKLDPFLIELKGVA